MTEQEHKAEAAGGASELTQMLGLKPCPFCGGTPEIRHKGNDHTAKRSVTIRCQSCRAERTDAAIRYGMDWLEKVAIENWNQRPNA